MAIDLAKYKEVFLRECKQHLEGMSHGLLALEKNPSQMEISGEIFRLLHTFKGIADTAEWRQLVNLSHAMEDVLDGIRKKRIKLGDSVDTLFECLDALGASLKALRRGEEEHSSDALVKKLHTLTVHGERRAKDERRRTKDEGRGTRDEETALTDEPEVALEKIQSVEVKIERLDTLMNLAEELLISRLRLERIKEALDHPELSAAVDALGRWVTDTQYHVMQARMVPIGFVFNRFPRMVRDLAKQQAKQVALELSGSDIELDRGVVDEIGEALVHLLRNAVDHGLETSEDRRRAGKPPEGKIRVTATRSKGFAVIEVHDDGRGLDLDEVKAAAIKKGTLSPNATKEEIINSIFSGVSTTQRVTPVSGRGFGLNIVKKTVESIGGRITVASEPKKGTTFTLEIPLTLAIIKTLFVEVGGRTYAVPAANVERLVTVKQEDIKGMFEYEAVVLEGEDIPLVRLRELFGLPEGGLPMQPIVVVRRGEEKLGLAVDNLMSTQEIVIKPLNKLVRESRYFAGSSIIGSGEVVLILDVANLMLVKRKEQLQ